MFGIVSEHRRALVYRFCDSKEVEGRVDAGRRLEASAERIDSRRMRSRQEGGVRRVLLVGCGRRGKAVDATLYVILGQNRLLLSV